MGEVKERRQAILDFLKENEGRRVSRRELMNFAGVKENTISKDITALKNNGNPIVSNAYGILYKVENPIYRYPDNKTEEGYSDPTAGEAMKSDVFGDRFPGDIWSVQNSNGTVSEYVVIRDFKTCVSCIPVSTISFVRPEFRRAFCVVIRFEDDAYVDCRKLSSKPSKYFVEKTGEVKNFDAIKNKLSSILSLPSGTVEVEKVVEKVVEKEVPVEVLKEVPVEKSIEPVEVALLRQRAEIYEKIAWAFLNMGDE